MDIVETVNHFTALALLYNSIGIQVEGDRDGTNGCRATCRT